MSRKLLFSIMLILLSVIIITGCGGDNANSTSDANGSNDNQDESNNNDENNDNDNDNDNDNNNEEITGQDDERTLTIALGNDVQTFDLHDHSNTTTESVHINMVNYLVKNEGADGFISDLAYEWENVDPEIWEFKLHEGVQFHNGDEFTAEDVKFSLERASSDETLRSYNTYNVIDKVEVIDDYTVRIHTHGSQPTLLNRISRASSGMMPKDYIEENGIDYFMNNPIGTGPYKFVEWTRDSHVTLERNENYWNSDYDSDWDTLVFRSVPESSTRVAEVLTDGVDISVDTPPTDWDRVSDNENTSIVQGPINRTMHLRVRHTEGYPTSDVRVRRAIDYAIDNQAIIDNVLGGGATPTRNRENPGTFGFSEDFHDTYVYDQDKARELLAEAGYADGFEMTLHTPSGRYPQDAETAQVIAGMLSEVGITVNVDILEFSVFIDMRNAAANEDIYLIGLANSLFDSAQGLLAYTTEHSEGKTDYSNPEADELYEAALTNMDPVERAEQYYRIQEISLEDLTHIYLFQLDTFYAVNDRIDFEPRLNEMWMVEDIKLK